MHRSACLAVALVLTLAGCGGEAAVPDMAIAFESKALLADADRVAIYFYPGASDCTMLRQTLPRPRSLHGPYAASLDDAGRESGILFRLEEIPVGTYVVFVDALRMNGENVGSGCAAGQQVFDQQISPIRIVISGS